MRLEAVDLSGADLSGADLSRVRMTGGSLGGARVDGSRWERAAIVAVGGVLEAGGRAGPDGAGGLAGYPELAVAAVVGRDEPELMVTPAAQASCAAFSPDGGLLVVGAGREVQVVETGTWTTLRLVRDDRGPVADVAFSLDGTLFASAGPGGGSTWDARTGAPAAGRVAFPPGGSTVRAGGWWARVFSGSATVNSPYGKGSARVYSEREQIEEAPYLGDGDFGEPVFRTRFFLELQGGPGKTRRYELDSEVAALSYGDGGAVLLAALADGTVRAWSVATGDHEVVLRLPEYCNALFTAANGELLFTKDTHGLSVWHLRTRRRRALLPVTYERLGRPVLVFSPDRSVLVTLSGGTTQAWDTATWELLATLGRRPQALAVALPPGASLVAAGYSDGTARVWDAAAGWQARVLADHGGPVAGVAFSPGGDFLATAGPSVRTWDAASWAERVMSTRLLSLSGVTSVAFSPDGTRLAGLETYGEVGAIWDAATGTCLRLVHRGYKEALAYAPDGTLLAAMHDRRHGVVLRIEDAARPSQRVLLTEKDCYSRSAAISPDGRLIVTWSWSPDQGTRAWRLPRRLPRAFPGRSRKRKPFARLGQDRVTCVAFSADSSLIFTGMADGTVRTWDAATGAQRPAPALTGHDGPVAAIAASPDGSTIATASGDNEASSGDGTVRVWDAGTGQAIATLAALPGGGHAAWFPDGSYDVDDGTGALWWAIKLCRFEPGELDPYLPALRRRGQAARDHPER